MCKIAVHYSDCTLSGKSTFTLYREILGAVIPAMASDNDSLSRDIYSVTRLNREVRAVLEGSFPALWVQGEVSNLARPASGHIYFSLKDKNSQVRCAMFKNRNRQLKFSLENGMEVIVRAAVSLYEGRGEFQLIVEQLEPAGAGALQRAFEELKAKLDKEGLFDSARKRPLPEFPGSVGVVTSPSGAAIRDILHVLKRRYPRARVVIYPVPVQGEGAGGQIARALEIAGRRGEADVLILARGGGSLEDLWAFNEEVVARAVNQSPIPVVTGIGHETDFTIADFCADHRSPTPSAAAEMASPGSMELMERFSAIHNKLLSQVNQRIRKYQEQVRYYEKRLPHPRRQLQNINQHLDNLSLRLVRSARTVIVEKRSALLKLQAAINHHNPKQLLRYQQGRCRHLDEQLRTAMSYYLRTLKQKLNNTAHTLHAVSPLVTLDRGYAIVTRADSDSIIRDAAELGPGDEIRTRLARGQIHSTVNKISDEKK
ncbi:MAG: exodeoxyribonuclease VII large subunit [Gammaproteobacteria bacterium]